LHWFSLRTYGHNSVALFCNDIVLLKARGEDSCTGTGEKQLAGKIKGLCPSSISYYYGSDIAQCDIEYNVDFIRLLLLCRKLKKLNSKC
jgi:hypothetical protein